MAKVEGKGIRLISVRSKPVVAQVPRETRPASIVPEIAMRAGNPGQRTWRVPAPDQPCKRAVYITWWDLCEVGFELKWGFLQHSRDWSFECLSAGSSWISERVDYRADQTDPGGHDFAVFSDRARLADVVHLCEGHTYPALMHLQPGKRMVMHHHGVAYRNNPGLYERQEVEAGYLRLVSTPDLLIYGGRRYRKTLCWLPNPITLTEMDRTFPAWEERSANAPVVVAHGWTVKTNKGTDQFEAIISDEMRRGTNLEYAPINHVQRRQSLWYISQCDVYFATFLYGPGMATIEAMALGKPVLVGCNNEELAAQRQCYGKELPFLHVTPETCGQVLRDLAADPDLRREYGDRGRKAVERLHDTPQVVKRLSGLYEQTEPSKAVVTR